MKSKILLILMSVVLLINMYDLRVFANTGYDHNELMKYNGYGQVMYDSIVEQTTFITGQYTDNKEYVEQSVQQIKDYANFWKNEYTDLGESCYQTSFMSCFGEMVERGGAYALTVGDWIKNLFTNYNEQENTEESPDHPLAALFSPATHGIAVNDGFYFRFYDVEKGASGSKSKYLNISASLYSTKVVQLRIGMPDRYKEVNVRLDTAEEALIYRDTHNNRKSDVSYILSLVSPIFNLDLSVYANDGVEVTFPSRPPSNSKISNITNYINENGLPEMIVPQPKAYLSCPDGTRVNMTINGGTFLDVNGQVMQVSNDGTATVDSQICNLGWEKPQVKYIDDRVGIITPDGDVIDAETGEILEEKPFDWEKEFDDEIEDGCGVVCIFGKLLKGLGEMAKALFAIPKAILDGLLDLLKKLFVPPDDYFTKEYDSLKKSFFNEEIEKNLSDLESLGGAGGGAFEDVNVNIMGTNAKIVDASSINKSLDTIHGWVRGIFYPLLLFFNISMLYRLIRGTSFVGIGKKGGGDS